MASAMTEVAVRLAEPDKLAEQSVASLGQTIRRQVAAMNDAISRAIGRAGELEALVHNEVATLERSYSDNELRVRGLISELASEREALSNNSHRVSESLRGVGQEIARNLAAASSSIDKKLAERGIAAHRAPRRPQQRSSGAGGARPRQGAGAYADPARAPRSRAGAPRPGHRRRRAQPLGAGSRRRPAHDLARPYLEGAHRRSHHHARLTHQRAGIDGVARRADPRQDAERPHRGVCRVGRPGRHRPRQRTERAHETAHDVDRRGIRRPRQDDEGAHRSLRHARRPRRHRPRQDAERPHRRLCRAGRPERHRHRYRDEGAHQAPGGVDHRGVRGPRQDAEGAHRSLRHDGWPRRPRPRQIAERPHRRPSPPPSARRRPRSTSR